MEIPKKESKYYAREGDGTIYALPWADEQFFGVVESPFNFVLRVFAQLFQINPKV